MQNNRLAEYVLADSLFTRIKPSLRGRFFTSKKHNVLFSICFTIDIFHYNIKDNVYYCYYLKRMMGTNGSS